MLTFDNNAKVSINMDFTESVSTQTSYDPENAAVLSEVKNSQKLNGSRPSPQGIPGARSNLPGETPQPGIPETRNNVDKELSTKNYNVPSKVTRSKKPTAGISKISAAVMIDGKQVPMVDAEGNPVESPLNDRVVSMELEQLKNVDRAIGIAGGSQKFAAIRGALRGGLINILITDNCTAAKLIE